MVASESWRASQIGAEVIEAGGNAVDAAIAVSFALSVIRPHATGIGGGGFALLKEPSKEAKFIDFRERAPQAGNLQDYFDGTNFDANRSRFGGLAVGTPGLPAGLEYLYNHYGSGKIPWKSLVTPAVEIAENGIATYPHLNGAIEWFAKNTPVGQQESFATASLLNIFKSPPPFRNVDLAKALRDISNSGSHSFYHGEIALDIVSTAQKNGGKITLHDLESYQVIERSVVQGHYGPYEIIGAPPPSSGGPVTIQVLNMLEPFLRPGGPLCSQNSVNDDEVIALKVKALRRAFEDRAVAYGDPAFWENDISKYLSKEYAKSRMTMSGENFPPQTTSISAPQQNTSHFSIVDSEGMVVSSTQSINYFFGAGIMSGRFGIILNNTIDDFSFTESAENIFGLVGGKANLFAPAKTPLSSMSPTIVMKDGDVFAVLGSPGGSKIISAVIQVILNSTCHQLSPSEAVFSPRVHHQGTPNILLLDSGGFSKGTISSLQRAGYSIEETDYGIGAVSAVFRDLSSGELTGVSDPRREAGPFGR